MPEDAVELRRINWSESLPFVRLFRTFGRALAARNLALALCGVLVCYVGGRVLDALWLANDGGVPQYAGDFAQTQAYPKTEIQAYAQFDSEQYRRFRDALAERWSTAGALRGQLDTPEHRAQADELVGRIDAQLDERLAGLEETSDLSDDDRRTRRAALLEAADYLRRSLAGFVPQQNGAMMQVPQVNLLFGAQERREVSEVVNRQQRLASIDLGAPRGPFISLWSFETHCFTAAVQGVCRGRFSFAGSALTPEPALLGSAATGLRGLLWLVTQRPVFAACLAALHLLVLALFGGALCRSAAVASAREESISFRAALQFAREKFTSLLFAPLFVLIVFLVAALCLFIGGALGGLTGMIPGIGGIFTILTGLFYFLALLGGVALVALLLGSLLGFHLMWPTIAVEGSDAFDAVSSSFSYVIQRIWQVAFYGFVLLLYGVVGFVLVRLAAMLLLKLTHEFTGAGLELFGWITSVETSTIGKLDAMWNMPDWQDLSLLPTVGGTPFWGVFANAPLSFGESAAMWLMRCWIYLLVGAVAAFGVSFYFCGSTEMYFLLRRSVDATDYEEIFYEEEEEDFDFATPGAEDANENQGTALPVVESQSNAAGDSSTPEKTDDEKKKGDA